MAEPSKDQNMADAARDAGLPTPPPTPGIAPLPKKFPKGVVLGKDGKPCRSCTSFAAWSAMAATKPAQTHSSSSIATDTSASSTRQTPATLPDDCPPDVEALGRASWTLLHSVTAAYPEKPSLSEQATAMNFVSSFGKLYPCNWCGEDFRRYMERNKVRVGSRDEFGRWMCEAHNEVNQKLGKNVFDCNKWGERWRTGWKDGRCG